MAFQNALTVGTDYSSTRNITGTGTELDPWYVYEIQDFLDAVYTQGSYVVLGADIDFKSNIAYHSGIPSELTIRTRELYGRAYPYKSTKTYAIGDKVSYDNGTQLLEYKCTAECTGIVPTDTDYWTSGNIQSYDDTASYSVGECCIFNNGIGNAVYICTDPCTGINPNNTAHWEMKNFLDKKVSGLIGGNITGYYGSSVISVQSNISGTSGYLYIYNVWFKDMVYYRGNSSGDALITADSSKYAYWYNCKFSGLLVNQYGGGALFAGNGKHYMYYCSGYFKYSRPAITQNSSLYTIISSGNTNTYIYDSFFIIDGLYCKTMSTDSTANFFLSIQNSTIILDLHVGVAPGSSDTKIPLFVHSGATWQDSIFICHTSYHKGDGGDQEAVLHLTHTSSSYATRVFTDSSMFGDMFDLVDASSNPIIQLTTEQLKDKDVLAEYGLLVNEVVN